MQHGFTGIVATMELDRMSAETNKATPGGNGMVKPQKCPSEPLPWHWSDTVPGDVWESLTTMLRVASIVDLSARCCVYVRVEQWPHMLSYKTSSRQDLTVKAISASGQDCHGLNSLNISSDNGSSVCKKQGSDAALLAKDFLCLPRTTK